MKETVISAISNSTTESISLVFEISPPEMTILTQNFVSWSYICHKKLESKGIRPFSPPKMMCLVTTCAGYKHCILIEELITSVMLIYSLILCILIVVPIRLCSIPDDCWREYAQYQRHFLKKKKTPFKNDSKSCVFQKSDGVLNYCLF